MVFDMTFLGHHRSSKRSRVAFTYHRTGGGNLCHSRRADSFALGICNGHLAKKNWDSALGGLLFSSSLKDSNLISILELRFKTPSMEQKVFTLQETKISHKKDHLFFRKNMRCFMFQIFFENQTEVFRFPPVFFWGGGGRPGFFW